MATTSSQPVGVVMSLKGLVSATRAGVGRKLNPGDEVYAGEVVVTQAGAAAEIILGDGSRLPLGPDATLSLDRDVYVGAGPEARDESIAAIESVQQAIRAGEDPSRLLDATASGREAGSVFGSEGGHDFVLVETLGQQALPESGYATAPAAAGPSATPVDAASGVTFESQYFAALVAANDQPSLLDCSDLGGSVIHAEGDSGLLYGTEGSDIFALREGDEGAATIFGYRYVAGGEEDVICLADIFAGSGVDGANVDSHVGLDAEGRLFVSPTGQLDAADLAETGRHVATLDGYSTTDQIKLIIDGAGHQAII